MPAITPPEPPLRTFARDNEQSLSRWSGSRAKRLFDISIVVAFLPIVFPVLLAIGLAVRLTSSGPAIFRQTRGGRFGKPFTIFKFRTMHDTGAPRQSIAAVAGDSEMTRLGRLLRWLKLDELPQVINVLRGEMSLVGPRPRVLEHQLGIHSCRPGITSPATLAFAREDLLLAPIPEHAVAEYYMRVVLPAKQRLDSEYMARATFRSDLSLLLSTFLRRWDHPAMVQQYALQDARELEWASAEYEQAGIVDN